MTRHVQPIQCIGCPTGCSGEVIMENGAVVELRGFTCDVGKTYAAEEVVAPKRMVTTTVRVEAARCPCCLSFPIGPLRKAQSLLAFVC